jgi:hypothetical protein
MSERLHLAIQEILAARDYTNQVLRAINERDWFRMPFEGVTHVAWQVGHLAMAQYSLALRRIRGQLPSDEQLIPASFLERFAKGSTPSSDPTKYPSTETIRAIFDSVHRQVLAELEKLDDGELDKPATPAHRLFNTKLGSLLWCSRHEMLHAGQIGLLRRLFGGSPMW